MIKPITVYTVICDGCGDDALKDARIDGYKNKEHVDTVAKFYNWIEIAGMHYCPKCYVRNENGKIVVL